LITLKAIKLIVVYHCYTQDRSTVWHGLYAEWVQSCDGFDHRRISEPGNCQHHIHYHVFH